MTFRFRVEVGKGDLRFSAAHFHDVSRQVRAVERPQLKLLGGFGRQPQPGELSFRFRGNQEDCPRHLRFARCLPRTTRLLDDNWIGGWIEWVRPHRERIHVRIVLS